MTLSKLIIEIDMVGGRFVAEVVKKLLWTKLKGLKQQEGIKNIKTRIED